jgi:HEAT repeat protein
MRFLNDPDDWTRRSTIISLGQIGDQETIDVIVSALSDSSRVVQLGSAEVLAEWGDERARNKLNELLATEWRAHARNALRRLNHEPNAPSIFDKDYDAQ